MGADGRRDGDWGPRVEDKDRRPRVEEHKHPWYLGIIQYFHLEKFEDKSSQEQPSIVILQKEILLKSRSSHLEVLLGKDVRKICSKFTGEHP